MQKTVGPAGPCLFSNFTSSSAALVLSCWTDIITELHLGFLEVSVLYQANNVCVSPTKHNEF